MVFPEKKSLNLNFLLKMSLQHQHHEPNYKEPLHQNIVTFASMINKLTAIQPIPRDFSNWWIKILYSIFRRLVDLLLTERYNIVEQTKGQVFKMVWKKHICWILKNKNWLKRTEMGNSRNYLGDAKLNGIFAMIF